MFSIEDTRIVELSVEFVLAGDMPFLLNIYGLPNLWSRNQFCLYCTTSRKNPEITAQERTLELMHNDFQHGSQKYMPVLNIQLQNVVPSTLHIFLGIASDFFKKIEIFAKKIDECSNLCIGKQIESILRHYHIERQAWFMTFTGNHVKKLIGTSSILEEIRLLFPRGHQTYDDVCYYLNLMESLGKIQKCAKAQELSESDIKLLSKCIAEFKSELYKIENPHITPKLHWLIHHVDNFAIRHGFWGLASEQSIEHFHHKVNDDLRQFAPIKNEEYLLRQIARKQDLRNYLYDTKK